MGGGAADAVDAGTKIDCAQISDSSAAFVRALSGSRRCGRRIPLFRYPLVLAYP